MNTKTVHTLTKAARGLVKADLVIKNGSVVNVFTKEIYKADIAVSNGIIAGVGRYEGIAEVDASGKYVCPGLIDAHVHIESSLAAPREFARTILPHGTTCVIADPHEIANVCGAAGIRYMVDQAEHSHVHMFFMAPSCVPGLTDRELKSIARSDKRIIGLGEVMDYHAVLRGQTEIIKKLSVFDSRIADGHAPGLTGRDLNAYCANGIATDHECTTTEEALEKLRHGMYVQVREGSAAKNLEEIIKGLLRTNTGFHRCVFCTDDKHLDEIREKGHIDCNIRKAIRLGVPPVDAISMGTINAAQCYNLRGFGAIAPGYCADLILLKDLDTFEIDRVFVQGRQLSEFTAPPLETLAYGCEAVCNTVNTGNISIDDLRVPLRDNRAAVIKIIPGQILTRKVMAEVRVSGGAFVPDERYAKLAVVERHRATGNIGLGIVEGFRIVNGAIGSTVSHDAHNIVAAGDNDRDILLAVEELKRTGGGFTAVRGGRVLETLELPIAGLMSGLNAAEIEKRSKSVKESAFTVCKNTDIEPFMTLSFLSLTAIPEIRLTDKGLFDVDSVQYIDIG